MGKAVQDVQYIIYIYICIHIYMYIKQDILYRCIYYIYKIKWLTTLTTGDLNCLFYQPIQSATNSSYFCNRDVSFVYAIYRLVYLETAINIGYSCKLLTEDMEVSVIDSDSEDGVEIQLKGAKMSILSKLDTLGIKAGFAGTSSSELKTGNMKTNTTSFAVILNGQSLVCNTIL